jgi:hypothetical protein
VSKRDAPRRTKTSRTPGQQPRGLDAAAYPALASFLKGYLHQDFPEEHGSVAAATAAFSRDASPDERRLLMGDLQRLLEEAERTSSRTLGRFVTRDLGSAWAPRSAGELADILRTLRGGD